ncbi:MAG: HEAT repeat domain-containing protein [Armatimonadetes bacterium]|nr:HEAT repeat domain-containing protein [Armatimonadota bacterium]
MILTLSVIIAYAQPTVGVRLTYQVTGQSASRFWQGALSRAASSENSNNMEEPLTLRQTYRYQLEQTILQNTGATLLTVEWRRWQTDAASQQAFGDLLREIQSLSPVYVRRQPTGALEFTRPTNTPAWARQAVGSILHPFQFVRDPKRREQWETQEAHPNGRARCRYRLVKRDAKQTVYNKAVVEVLLTPEEKQLGKTHQILGHLEYTFDAQGTLVRVRGTLRERVALRGLPVSHNDMTLDIRLTTRRRLPSEHLRALQQRARRALAATQWYALHAPPTEQEQEYARAQSLLQGETPQALLQALDRALETPAPLNDPAAQQSRLELQRKLEAGFILYDIAFVQAVIDRLRTRPNADDGFWMLLGVLSRASRPEAQNALLAVLQESSSAEQQQAIARQLMFLASPSAELLRDLWAFTRERATGDLQTLLGLSLSALVGRNPEQPLAQEIAQWCLQQLERAEDPIVWLNMLGNLRRNETLPILERYARTGNEQVRQASVVAMAKFTATDVLPVWTRLYEQEPALTVRQAIIEQTASFWENPQARQLLERAAFNDPEPQARKAVVQALAPVAARDKDALALLVRIAETNSMPAIRREAMIVLAVLRTEGVQVPPVRSAP